MIKHRFERTQSIPISLNEAWMFFSNPRNLARITPAALDFQIISPVPEHVHNGLRVEYRVRPLLGIPLTWVSEIQEVEAPHQFVDIQVQGPYRFWHHLHRFWEVPGGVMMQDTIDYAVPFCRSLPFLNDLVVRRQLDHIFDYRQQTLQRLFVSK